MLGYNPVYLYVYVYGCVRVHLAREEEVDLCVCRSAVDECCKAHSVTKRVTHTHTQALINKQNDILPFDKIYINRYTYILSIVTKTKKEKKIKKKCIACHTADTRSFLPMAN